MCVGVPQFGEDEVATPKHEHDMFRNAQAMRVIRSSLCTMEYNKVRGIVSAKEIWDTFKMSHEGNDEVIEGNDEVIEGKMANNKRIGEGSSDAPPQLCPCLGYVIVFFSVNAASLICF